MADSTAVQTAGKNNEDNRDKSNNGVKLKEPIDLIVKEVIKCARTVRLLHPIQSNVKWKVSIKSRFEKYKDSIVGS